MQREIKYIRAKMAINQVESMGWLEFG